MWLSLVNGPFTSPLWGNSWFLCFLQFPGRCKTWMRYFQRNGYKTLDGTNRGWKCLFWVSIWEGFSLLCMVGEGAVEWLLLRKYVAGSRERPRWNPRVDTAFKGQLLVPDLSCRPPLSRLPWLPKVITYWKKSSHDRKFMGHTLGWNHNGIFQVSEDGETVGTWTTRQRFTLWASNRNSRTTNAVFDQWDVLYQWTSVIYSSTRINSSDL